MQHTHIGFIGLGVMGSNFVQNFANNGVTVTVYNRSKEKTDELMSLGVDGINATYSLEELVQSLPKPRLIHLMVSSAGVDAVTNQLVPLIEEGDTIVDLGNSNWHETIRRETELKEKGIKFVGCGVSGGAEGAKLGPSIMPGGEKKSVDFLVSLYEKVAAKDFNGGPCVINCGTSAAGHFVKMVHNGIEYAIMQSIAELFGHFTALNYTNEEIWEIIDELNTGKLESYLLDITANILKTKKDDEYLVDLIDPKAKGKGTGKWTVEAALDLGVAIPSIGAAVFQRYLSAKDMTLQPYNGFDMVVNDPDTPVTDFDLTSAMETIWRLVYIQGLELIQKADEEYGWGVNLSEVLRIWQGGCIIRSKLLEDLLNTLESEELFNGMSDALALSQQSFVAMPVIRGTIDYGLSITSDLNEMSMVQAQRDFFGQHTYRLRGDKDDHTGGWVTE